MGKITIEVEINTFGTMGHPNTYGELQQQQMHNTTSFAKIRIYFTTVPSSINYQVPFYLELLCNFFAKEFNPIITSAIRFII